MLLSSYNETSIAFGGSGDGMQFYLLIVMIQSILDSNNKSIGDVRIHSQCQCGIKLMFRDIFSDINYNDNYKLVDSNRQLDIIHSWKIERNRYSLHSPVISLKIS